ncbi:MAG: nitroreductase family protein [Cytophagales bacterium]|nr:nitroreductase family protein [Cytophagales bacterium]
MPTNTIDYHREIYSEHKMLERSQEFYQWIDLRRTVRDFSDKPVPKKVMENIIMAASTAPSGAHKQPWTFCLVEDAKLKSAIRKAAEEEEYINYHGRMSEEWLKDLNPLQTNWDKEFIDTVPWLIVVFKRAYEKVNGKIKNNYYVSESVGIAAGFLLAAIHHAGLVALTHTPSPMNFLNKILKRPDNERPFLLIPVGYPADNVKVPDLKRKQLKEVLVYY